MNLIYSFIYCREHVYFFPKMTSLINIMLHDHSWLSPGITMLPIGVPHFELNMSLIAWVISNLQFSEDETEDPMGFLHRFRHICSTVSYLRVLNEMIWLLLISFALRGKAKEWLDMLPPDTITSWEEFLQLFLK